MHKKGDLVMNLNVLRMGAVVLTLGVASTGYADNARADDPAETFSTIDADVGCLAIVLLGATLNTDPAAEKILRLLAVFYMGRIDGRNLQGDQAKSVKEAMTKMSKMPPQDVRLESKKCADRIAEALPALKELAK